MAYALFLFFCPWKQNFDHDLPVFHSLTPMAVASGYPVAARGGAGCFRLGSTFPARYIRHRMVFLQLLPTSLIPRNDLLSERNLYLASIGILLVDRCPRVRSLTHWLINGAVSDPGSSRSPPAASRSHWFCCLCVFTYPTERTLSRSGPTLVRHGREIPPEGETAQQPRPCLPAPGRLGAGHRRISYRGPAGS